MESGDRSNPFRDVDEEVLDDVFDALSESPRRQTMYFLLEHERASVDELADVVAGWTASHRSGMVTREERDRIWLSLHHQHLPVLESAGLLVRDTESGVVTLEEFTGEVRTLIEFIYTLEETKQENQYST